MKTDGVIVYYLLAVLGILIPIYLGITLDATDWINKLLPKYKKGMEY